MTFNLRFENDADGDNAWALRRELVARVIEAHAPDILATQEGKAGMLTWLAGRLEEYSLHVPANRVIDDDSQYPSLFFRPGSFELLAGADRWLSPTPDVHLSKGWDSAFARMMSWALLRERDRGRELVAVATHLDHVSPEARHNQARLVAEFAASRSEPLVVMGDFNDAPGSATHRALVGGPAGLRDAWQALGRPEGPGHYTAHRFDGLPRKQRLDWVLAGPTLTPRSAVIVRDSEDGRWPSDHFPVLVELEL